MGLISIWKKVVKGNKNTANVSDDHPMPAKLVEVDGRNPLPVKNSGGTALGHETLNVSNNSAIGFAALPDETSSVVITVENDDVRFWVDGTDPTSTQGHLVGSGGWVELDSKAQANGFRVIAVSGSAILQVTYFKL